MPRKRDVDYARVYGARMFQRNCWSRELDLNSPSKIRNGVCYRMYKGKWVTQSQFNKHLYMLPVLPHKEIMGDKNINYQKLEKVC